MGLSVCLNIILILFIIQDKVGIKNLYENIKKHGFKYFTMDRAKIIYDYEYIKRNGLKLDVEEIESFSEQLVYRKIMCEECVSLGKCKDCGCPMSKLLVTPTAKCSQEQWEETKPPKEWEEFKNNLGIKFGLK